MKCLNLIALLAWTVVGVESYNYLAKVVVNGESFYKTCFELN